MDEENKTPGSTATKEELAKAEVQGIAKFCAWLGVPLPYVEQMKSVTTLDAAVSIYKSYYDTVLTPADDFAATRTYGIMGKPFGQNLSLAEVGAIYTGQVLEAIKLLRMRTQLSLADAKQVVEYYQSQMKMKG